MEEESGGRETPPPGASATPEASPPPARGLSATREKRARAGINSRLADFSVDIGRETQGWVDEWRPKRGRWGGGRWGGGRGGRGGGWRADAHEENKERDRWVGRPLCCLVLWGTVPSSLHTKFGLAAACRLEAKWLRLVAVAGAPPP